MISPGIELWAEPFAGRHDDGADGLVVDTGGDGAHGVFDDAVPVASAAAGERRSGR